MPRIAPADQLLMVLQERLSALGKDRMRTERAASPRERDALSRARTLADLEGLDPDERRRVVVRGLLVREMGDEVANDPSFAAVAEDVLRIIADDAAGRALLDRALSDLTVRR